MGEPRFDFFELNGLLSRPRPHTDSVEHYFALVGFFLLRAAVTYDANEATGLDGALRRLAVESWGLVIVLIVVVVEIGLISPPVGMNLFVLKTLLPNVHQSTVFRGVLPFIAADVVRMALLIDFPMISLYLPSLMK